MASYRTRVKRDIAVWTAAGLIDPSTAEKLSAEVERRSGRPLRFGAILAMLAALLLATAAIVFVAADWEAIPRSLRAIGLGALVAAFLAGGAALRRWEHQGWSEAAFVAAAGAWGACIILVGQMFDLPRNEQAVLLPWCVGTGVAALAFRSRALTVCAALLAAAWLAYGGLSFGGKARVHNAYPLLAAAVWLVSLRSGSRAAREILLLSLTLYLALLVHDSGSLVLGGLVMAAGAGALFILASRRPAAVERALRLDGRAPLHFLVAALVGMGIVQGAEIDTPGFALAAAATLAVLAAALLTGGRAGSGVRRLIYAAFVLEVCVIYGVTVGTLLDTAAFLLAAALLLGVLALLVTRVERRLQGRWERAGQEEEA